MFPEHCYFTVCLRTTLHNADFREFECAPGFNINRKCYGIFTCVNIDLATKQVLACLNSLGIAIEKKAAIDVTPGMSFVCDPHVIEKIPWSLLLKKLPHSGLLRVDKPVLSMDQIQLR